MTDKKKLTGAAKSKLAKQAIEKLLWPQHEWKKGDEGVFIGYAQESAMTEDDKLLFPGDRVTIFSVDDRGAMAAIPLVAAGEEPREGETVYKDEIVTIPEWEERQRRRR